jgi:uncharacterized protein (DUF58 family)
VNVPVERPYNFSFQVDPHALSRFLGCYRSVFKGQGMDYDEIRPYTPGDDPKAFVWAKFAQLQEPYVKTFLEERDLNVCVALDISGSMLYRNSSKAQRALQTAALLIYAAGLSRDKTSLALFSSHVEKFVPPGRTMKHAGLLVQILSSLVPTNQTTDIKSSLRELGALSGTKRGLLFIISDFICDDPSWQNELSLLASHNDVILIRIFNRYEVEIPTPGWVIVEDPESGEKEIVYLGNGFVNQSLSFAHATLEELVTKALHSKVSLCLIKKDENPLEILRNFFERRHAMLRQGREICMDL